MTNNDNLSFTKKNSIGFFQDPLYWMVHHAVSANLIMVILLGLGLVLMLTIKKEVFPEFASDHVIVIADYPGASVSSLETAVALPIENAIAKVDNVGDVQTSITEGTVEIRVEILNSSTFDTAYRNIENHVTSITSFPSDMPKPVVHKQQSGTTLLYLMVYSQNASKADLKHAIEIVRGVFADDSETGRIDIPGEADYEIRVEVPEANLRKYDLTLEDIGKTIAASGIDMSAGTIKSNTENVELRFNYHKNLAADFKNIIIRTTPSGSPLYLKDVATVTDTFNEDFDLDVSVDNILASLFVISAKEGQTPRSVSKAVHQAVIKARDLLPPGFDINIIYDITDLFKDRAKVLIKEGGIGVLLVILVLSLFLDWRLAFWTSFGIPISFLGSFLILTTVMAPFTGFSINIISLFAFIIVLGIVIDDAIVVGENIYHHKELLPGNPKLATAEGVKEVASSAFFSIFTNILAFLPLAFLPGPLGKFFRQIPIVVIFVLLVSLFESLFILPARISFPNKPPAKNIFARAKRKFNDYFDLFIEHIYGRVLKKVVTYRYIALALMIGVFAIFIGYLKSGKMGLVLMPEALDDMVTFYGKFPADSTLATKVRMRETLVNNALEVINHHGGKSIYKVAAADIVNDELNIRIFLQPAAQRTITSQTILDEWEARNGDLVGLQQFHYSAALGMPGGRAQITMEISHANNKLLAQAINEIVDVLSKYTYVTHVEDENTRGYKRYNFTLNEIGYALGLTPYYVGNQIRNFVFGYQAIEQVKERNTQKVVVRLPKDEINSSNAINKFIIKTPTGTNVPLADVVEISTNLSEPQINRLNYKRNVSIYGYVSPDSKSSEILAEFLKNDLPNIKQSYPGLECHLGGRQKEMIKVGKALIIGIILTLIAIYTALAMFFDSYIQPLIIMIAIPFGFIGAIIGHIVMGFSLSIPSMFGLLALSGIVVNASMIIIYFTNVHKYNTNMSSDLAIIEVSKRRFRPILLTALTSLFGMLPTIVSNSNEVAFLRPIAVAIGFGVIFATLVTLVCMPVFYLILEDIKNFFVKPAARQS